MANSLDALLAGVNGGFVAEQYEQFLQDPGSVQGDWRELFTELTERDPALRARAGGGASAEAVRRATTFSVRARILIRCFRMLGHLEADLDPLKLRKTQSHKDLDYRTYGFTEGDLDTPIYIDRYASLAGHETATLREILEILRHSYCSTIGVEYMHVEEIAERSWIQQHVEQVDWRSRLTRDARRQIYLELAHAEGFESYLQVKYPGTKRFGLDGGESTIPCLEQLLRTASSLGVEEVVVGMPHRGRLNVLARTLAKPYRAILAEFQGNPGQSEESVLGSGDVKYHLGASADREIEGRPLHLSLAANPSHLEAVNPVVLGKVRAKQAQRGDEARERVMGLLLHGDAAFAGQGVVPESIDLSQLRGYRTGGTIHLIVNNQIGFTTNPVASRSTPYATDVAKGLNAPIFHVNGDDPDAVNRVADLAARFRQRFKRDVVIDLFCYRRHGHNEADEPMFTQPIMYRAIAEHPTTLQIYGERLAAEGVLTQDELASISNTIRADLDTEFEESARYRPRKADWMEGKWEGLSRLIGEEEMRDDPTAVSLDQLRAVGLAISRVPDGINANAKLVRQLDHRRKTIESGSGIDWATAEALAFGTLLTEGTPVRLSGQDSCRGTFSQRHSAIVDQDDERRYYPLSNISPGKQAPFEVMDSPLSEFAVLGFEYGYSLADPHTLVAWEAQFGDFANNAQAIFDQFISSGESKWLRMSGLVVLLPHGFEGQGPEHSSARLERFLQQCAQDNMQVVSCTTPANYFHVLRRQMRRNFRKPLVVMAPKSLLRHKLVLSDLADMGPGSGFRRVLGEVENTLDGARVRRVILCSGKVYYDLFDQRRELGLDDVALVRIEQFYPWPRDGVERELSKYPNAEVVWCQEEPANMGGWLFVLRRIEYILEDEAEGHRELRRPIYAGRPASASPATGHLKVHQREQALLVEQALTWKTEDLRQPFMRIPDE